MLLKSHIRDVLQLLLVLADHVLELLSLMLQFSSQFPDLSVLPPAAGGLLT